METEFYRGFKLTKEKPGEVCVWDRDGCVAATGSFDEAYNIVDRMKKAERAKLD